MTPLATQLLLPLALLVPPRVAPAPQPDATPVALPAVQEVPESDRQRRDRFPPFAGVDGAADHPPDRITVQFAAGVRASLADTSAPLRAVLCMRTARAGGDSLAAGSPANAPASTAWSAPLQPFGSASVHPGTGQWEIDFPVDALWWPCPPAALDGSFEIQVVITGDAASCALDAPGTWTGPVVQARLDSGSEDRVPLVVDRRVADPGHLPLPGIEWIEVRSALRSSALGRDQFHRAAVIFPRDYANVRARQRIWPAVYVIPPAGDFEQEVAAVAQLVQVAGGSRAWPSAVHVVLDPSCANGHSGFVDSAAEGPWATALVSELVPYLEGRFRLVREPSARLLLGHGAGGRSALWLAVEHPEVFGEAFASSPDAVDFSRLLGVDIYRDESLYAADDGTPRAALRVPFGPRHDLVEMRISEQVQAAFAVSPSGRTGTPWDQWAALFSPVGAVSGVPRRICDPRTGRIDPVTVEAWAALDLTRRVRSDRAGAARTLAAHARILVGDRDEWMREQGVAGLQEALVRQAHAAAAERAEFPLGPGWIEVVPGADNDDVRALSQLRFGWEMRDHLVGAGHQE